MNDQPITTQPEANPQSVRRSAPFIHSYHTALNAVKQRRHVFIPNIHKT